jgi:DNA-binding transcriptional ArsR family regulator
MKNGARDWYVWSSHGSVLFHIAAHPGCSIQDVADGIGLTTRTIWSIVGDLQRAGMVECRRQGRRNRYRVNLNATFRHPTIKDVPLRTVLGTVVESNGNKSEKELARR